MKTKLLVILTVLLTLLGSHSQVVAQSTAFTYQGRLNDGPAPANGTYHLRFALFDSLTVGNQVGSPLTNSPVNVSNGLFTVALDFGANFPGAGRWLEIGVRTNGSGAFTTLIPRQPITATPYAITAGNLSVALPSANLNGTYWNAVNLNNAANSFSGNGSNLTALNASQLASGTVPAAALSNAWKLGGNPGTAGAFLGTVDSQPVVLASGNSRVLSLETKVVVSLQGVVSTAVNVLGGANINTIANEVIGATIGGGGSSDVDGLLYTPHPNTVWDAFGTVGGGLNNTAGSADGNTLNGIAATVAGGEGNQASGSHSSIGGGLNNLAAGSFSFAAGNRAKANHNGSFVWADSQNADFASTAENQFNIRAAGGLRVSGSGGGEIMEVSPGGTLIALAGYFSGDVFVGNNQNFGNTTRQMLNLWGTQYGIGVQSYTMYSRADVGAGFAWYQGGTHSNAAGDSGGGQTLMSLDSSGATLPGSLRFGTSSFRQMLDLWAGEHGIGVQPWTTYFRTIGGGANGSFAWYRGGVHSDVGQDPGTGGEKLMSLTAAGLVVSGTGNGIQATTSSGVASAVYGQNDGGGWGVAGRTTGTGIAVYGDNASPSGWAGNFNGRVFVGDDASVCSLTIRGGCDLAEPFEMSDREIPKGSLVIIDEENAGKLKLARQEYDPRVAGIVSGANGVNPGISLHQEGVMDGGQNVALSGRVYALADASHGAIKPGDLLTSSNLPGHVMKVTDHVKAQGTIVGKAMSALKAGQGLVLVLVSLQ